MIQTPLHYSKYNKRNEAVHLVEWGLAQEWIQVWSRDRMGDHSLDWLGRNKEGIEQNSTQHAFVAAPELSNSGAPFCPHDLDFFFLWHFWAFSCHSCCAHSMLHFTLHPEQWSMMICAVMPANTWHMSHTITILQFTSWRWMVIVSLFLPSL